MPINLKELFIADTSQIKIEKINYNFDQIIAVGGQIGPKGLKGDFGPIGPEGEKGQKGEIGPVGVPGENGSDGFTSWISVENTAIDSNILKPIFDAANQNSVYIGDTSQSPTIEGDNSVSSVLVIGRPQLYENHIELKGQFNSLTVKGEFYNSGGVALDVFSIKKGGFAGGDPVKLDVAFDDIAINSTGTGLLGNINIGASESVVVSADSGFNVLSGTISTFGDRVFASADLIVTGTGFTKVSSGNVAQRNDISDNDLQGGAIRYNTDDNKLEAYYDGTAAGSVWLPLRELTDSDKDTRVDISLVNDNDRIDLVTDGDVAMRLGGTSQDLGGNNLKKPIITNYNVFSQENVHFSNKNKGISFHPGTGGNSPAPNAGSTIAQRTLHDYFQRPAGFFDLDNDNFVQGTSSPVSTNSFNQYFGFTKDNCVITNNVFRAFNGQSSGPSGANLVTALDTNRTKLAYTKIGNMITVNAVIAFSNQNTGVSIGSNEITWSGDDSAFIGIKIPGLTDIYENEVDISFPVYPYNFTIQSASSTFNPTNYFLKWTKGTDYMRLYVGNEPIGGGSSIYAPSLSQVECPSFNDDSDTSNNPMRIEMQFSFFASEDSYDNPPLISTNPGGIDPSDERE